MSDQTVDGGGVSQVARGRTHLPGAVRAAGAAACGLAVLAGLAWVVWPRPPRDPAATPSTTSNWGRGVELPERPFRIAPATIPVVAHTAPPEIPVTTVPAPRAASVPAPAAKSGLGFWEDASTTQQLAQQAAARTTRAPGIPVSDPDVATPSPGNSEYAQRMQSTHFADAAPVPHRFHVSYTVKKGTIFPCTPASPISSALPGPVQCTVDQDVWSMDGTTILLPRGTQVNGSVERGLTNGEDRLFLVWTDALTPRPDLLAIPLDSPAADEMGLTGAPGDVNDHLWRRVKAALLLSLVDIGGNVASAAAQSGRGNTNLNLGSVGGTATTLGQMAFGRDLNIPPTLYRGPGQSLSVYVNHYIDLFRFYQNRPRD